MKAARQHVSLIFDIRNQFAQKIGECQIPVHVHIDTEKWKNPDLLRQDAIGYFKLQQPQYKDDKLSAFYTGDFIP